MTLVTILFFLFMIMGMPVPFAFGISGVAFFLQNLNLPLTMPVQLVLSQTQNFLLLAIPLFILAGNLLNESGITERVMRLASVLTGHMRAGTAQSNMVIAASLGGITSSAIGDAAMLSRVLGPSMTQRGYSGGFSAAVIGCSALITTMIPPGIGLVLYGSIAEVSIGRLFTAGMIPGILMTIFLMVAVSVRARRKGYLPERDRRAPLKEVARTFIDSIWAFLFPVVLIAGLRFGVFTPSEAGAFACVYAIAVGTIVYRQSSWKGLQRTLESTVVDIGMVMLLIALSATFSYGIVWEQIPQRMADFILGISITPWVVMLVIITFLLVAGTAVDSTVLILMLTSILVPVAEKVNVDLVHFGIIMVLTLTLGLLTPPEGAVLYIVCTIFRCSLWDFVREGWVLMLSIVVVVVMVIFWPDLALWLPNLTFGAD
ncbi:MAG: C4-dicarboxylate ABC transporter [Candidatus Rokubacteria bacterium RBG_16_73_20]|nr:MAG: C4-dicarboxylate ABC transporter [Candidatus Rokubacteria bacterium GWA2_73_35]OGK93992.1 MAG: C4-dicarboxylate ABC transporter [Candidatus Rokubacteria bacterium RBG_16_73_20]HBH03569.1 C4-dicarboxylate ABC transporter [Candidatus Rokubacteria bacterium]